ncbi:hypothetical protein [Flavobacterium magnum]|nr:hypothetical protein [Flavobacterium magnum]
MYSLLLFVTFFLCYLEWADKSAFLFQAQYDLLFKNDKASLVHPLILGPAIGQLLLLFSLWKPDRRTVLCGMLLLGLLALMVLITGIFSGNWKIILSVMPFGMVSGVFVLKYKRLKTQKF